MFKQDIQISDSERITLSWEGGWTHLSMKFNAVEVADFTDKATLEMGKWVNLPNGKTVLVRLMQDEIEIWDGQNDLVSGLKSGQTDNFKNAWKALAAYGTVFALMGLVMGSFDEGNKEWRIFLGISVLGFLYDILATWAYKKQDKLPLIIALIVHGLISVLVLISGSIIPAVLMGILVFSLYKGVKSEQVMTSKIEQLHDDNLLDSGL
jgi:hypothetical protein